MGNDGESGVIEIVKAPQEEADVRTQRPIPWTGGKCGDCYYWVRQNPALRPGMGNCVVDPPAVGVVLGHVQGTILTGGQPTVAPIAVTMERETGQAQGCGRFFERRSGVNAPRIRGV